MDQIKKVPKILSSIKDLQSPSYPSGQLEKLKQQVSTFIHDVKNQFTIIIGHYQKQLSQIKMESEILKRSRNTTHNNNQKQYQSTTRRSMSVGVNNKDNKNNHEQYFIANDSPILPIHTNRKDRFYQTAGSQFYSTIKKPFNQMQSNELFPSWGSTFQIRNISPNRQRQSRQQFNLSKNIYNQNDNHFPQQLINPQFQHERTFHRSRYERHSQRKRQKQQQIVHFLQSHQKNLNENTYKMMALIGKQVKNNDQAEQEYQNQENNNTFNNQKSNDDDHNRSLSQICDSLDKSFVSQKARKGKMKKKQAQQNQKKKKIEQQQQNQKIRKQRALKNLLQRLRDNANSVNPPQIVKASKLIPTGAKSSIVFNNSSIVNIKGQKSQMNNKDMVQSKVYRKNSKVMINPVPLQNNAIRNRESSPKLQPQKRPTSILKQSSNILTRSISGISAISFQQ